MAELKQSKQMVFQWCKSGAHDKCRRQYGGDRIVCSCDCGEEHGTNYTSISKAMTEEEVRVSIEALNAIMVGDAGDGVSQNRAVQATSSVWGDQVKEGNSQRSISGGTASGASYSGYNYHYKEMLDASSIEELEQRRNVAVKYEYADSFDAWL